MVKFPLQHLRPPPELFDGAHPTMAETYLAYLSFQRIKDPPAGALLDPGGTPFLEYLAIYWGTHIRVGLSDLAKTFALQLLDRFDSYRSAEFP